MKNIALLHYSYPPIVGGVEEIVRQQASLFHHHGHKIKVLAGRGSGGQIQKNFIVKINPLIDSATQQILDIQAEAVKNDKLIQKLSRQIFKYLKQQLKGFDVLIAHNVLTMPYNLPLTLALQQMANEKSIRIISWNHDSPYFYNNYPAKLDAKPWNILRVYNPHIDYITISQNRAKEFKKLYNADDAIEVIEDGIDPFFFLHLNKLTVRLIQEENLFKSDLIIVQPSRLHPRKNIEKSLAVLKALKDLKINVKLLLSSSYDPHEKSTKNYFKKLIRLADALNVRENVVAVAEYVFKNGENITADQVIIRDLYMIADILFLPSKQEGFGLPLLEAGLVKLPIACSDIPSFKSIAGDDVIYFDLNEDAAQIAKRINNFLAQLLPHRLFWKVRRHYVWDNLYEQKLKKLLDA